MDAARVYALLQEACRMLEGADDLCAAAYVSQAMALVHGRYEVGHDHLDEA